MEQDSTTTKKRRQTLIVDEPVQRRMILSVALLPLLALIAAAAGITFFGLDLVEQAAATQSELPAFPLMLICVYAFILVFGLLVVRQVLDLSHRVVGPNYRIIQGLRRIRKGDLDFRIELRRRDFNVEVAAEVNHLIEWLCEKNEEEECAPDVHTESTEPDSVPTGAGSNL